MFCFVFKIRVSLLQSREKKFSFNSEVFFFPPMGRGKSDPTIPSPICFNFHVCFVIYSINIMINESSPEFQILWKVANTCSLEATSKINNNKKNNNKNRVLQALEVFKDTSLTVIFVSLLQKRGQHFIFLALLVTTQQLQESMNFWE